MDNVRSDWVGPVDKCCMKPYALDKNVSKRLWDVSEKAAGFLLEDINDINYEINRSKIKP